MMRGVFLKILLWFWVSLVLVAVTLELTITATTTPFEERVHRFSDNALTGQAREAVVLLDRGGAPSVDRFFADLQHRTGIRAVLLNAARVRGRRPPARADAPPSWPRGRSRVGRPRWRPTARRR